MVKGKMTFYYFSSIVRAHCDWSIPHSTVWPAKSKTLFLRALFQDKEI